MHHDESKQSCNTFSKTTLCTKTFLAKRIYYKTKHCSHPSPANTTNCLNLTNGSFRTYLLHSTFTSASRPSRLGRSTVSLSKALNTSRRSLHTNAKELLATSSGNICFRLRSELYRQQPIKRTASDGPWRKSKKFLLEPGRVLQRMWKRTGEMCGLIETSCGTAL